MEQILPKHTDIVTNPINSGIAGIFQPDIGHPLNIRLNVVPNDTIKCNFLLDRDFLSHPRVIVGVSNGRFEVEIKRTDIISFKENLN